MWLRKGASLWYYASGGAHICEQVVICVCVAVFLGLCVNACERVGLRMCARRTVSGRVSPHKCVLV